jgi:hypothetical protein
MNTIGAVTVLAWTACWTLLASLTLKKWTVVAHWISWKQVWNNGYKRQQKMSLATDSGRVILTSLH